jgi:hypothetical protein
MGLDMYLEARKYVRKFDWMDIPSPLPDGASFNDYVTPAYKALAEMFPERLTKHSDTGAEVALTVGQWRKANQIHGWFVRNVQNGDDDCKQYSVSREQLQELLGTVTMVLDTKNKSVAKEHLPVTAGFFFGNYSEDEGYDQYYWEQLEDTRDILTDVLAETEEQPYDFYYQSSW